MRTICPRHKGTHCPYCDGDGFKTTAVDRRNAAKLRYRRQATDTDGGLTPQREIPNFGMNNYRRGAE